eukprot:g32622.t1
MKSLMDALEESDVPRPPAPPPYINMTTLWTSKESPSAVMTLLETSLQSIESTVDFTAKRERFLFLGHLTSGGSIVCEFMCKLYWVETDKLTVVEFRRRSGCGITFNRFVTSVKDIFCPIIEESSEEISLNCLADMTQQNLEPLYPRSHSPPLTPLLFANFELVDFLEVLKIEHRRLHQCGPNHVQLLLALCHVLIRFEYLITNSFDSEADFP